MKLKLTRVGNPPKIIDIHDTATYGEFVQTIAITLSLATNSSSNSNIHLFTGFPPNKVQGNDNDTLVSLGIKGGSVIDVRIPENTNVSSASTVPVVRPSSSSSSSSTVTTTTVANKDTITNINTSSQPSKPLPVSPTPVNGWACSVCTFVNRNASSVNCDVCGSPRSHTSSSSVTSSTSTRLFTGMFRHVVPADNTCLFTSIGWLMDRRMDRGSYYRQRVTEYLAKLYDTSVRTGVPIENPLFTEAGLGRSLPEYIIYMGNPNTWGGAIELTILASLLTVEIAAIEIQTGHVYRFGENKNYTQRIYVIYDGVHYDALHYKEEIAPGIEVIETLLPAGDALVDSALSVAKELKTKRQFVDTNRFTLMCGNCSIGIVGQKEAIEHAKVTGHTNFQEYRKD